MTPLEQAIDDAFMCGQIDALSRVLVPGYDPAMEVLRLALDPDSFVQRRDELVWSLMAWSFAVACAVAAGR